MGILSRFKDIMASNVNALLDRAEDPEKTIDQYMRSLHQDLGKVKAEAASMLADEGRARRALDECNAEIRKLQRYAEKSVEAGKEEEARKFLERKAALAGKQSELQTAYELASANAAKMKQMQDKLVADIGRLEARHSELKGKLAAIKMNSGGSSLGDVNSSFDALEVKANRALDEAMALAELRAGSKEDDLDDLIAQLEEDMRNNAKPPTNAEDELAALKEKLNKKE
ncbi:PspA/IM30 family protein [Paenibacillus thiaminolyticus]|uniref:PspA/IM30 family protein n=1 Tax=Paenibacillus thiaminolyticus TaxID=49283 RepID=A0AAP9DVU8_PANTH|nr:PspA/IM30 family protein [Paenibacillus thiaminolyticus]MCY9538992.1 PspA/IM30 family protein [Paenibacillus thiaminolyticus]MCY9604222.1 PspA/IM30 family protein [Paenibacillus thiaminolyticus]MCY9608104.1 PspA/IM30 family protein [Paenibacillus thiaminolyticus]MCY9612942.1 PspA/IM30 family protein [Paenibacillus thiaminolyticus]MCY9622003.1 PspA/IM30 family protein [Paenibacillus thiaminolyticus]